MDIFQKLQENNVIYTQPGQTDRSAMPMGNGELCASVWMSEDGILRFYLARSDALLETDVTAKLGMVRIATTPNFLSQGGFRQTLVLGDGRIEVESALGKLSLFIPPQHHTIYVTGTFTQSVEVEASYYTWRGQADPAPKHPWLKTITRTADVVEKGSQILFYHRNGENGIKELAKFQGVADVGQVPDFLTNRTFGGVMELEGGIRSETGLRSTGTQCCLQITTCSGQFQTPEEFVEAVGELQKRNPTAQQAYAAAAAYWNRLWQDSYVFVSGDEPAGVNCTLDVLRRAGEPMECNSAPSQVTRGYLLTRYMIACCKDGNFPIFYNGYLFNLTPGNREHLAVETFAGTFTSQPQPEPDAEFNPDERSWTIEHLWQNLRLPYYTMLATGDYESLKKLFVYFLRFQGLNRQRAKAYYGAQGQHNTEMNLSCGVQSAEIYGVDRTGKHPGRSDNSWGGSIEISPGLELLNLMLDYCDFAEDGEFFEDQVLEYAHGIFDYIATRFCTRKEGKIRIEDINCIETYFHTVNPLPIVAGMRCTLEKILNTPLGAREREYFRQMLQQTPELPEGLREGVRVLLPAEEYTEKRWNIELPELYAVYPFGLFSVCKANAQLAKDSFHFLVEKYGMMKPHTIGNNPGTPGYSGWHYIGTSAAMLGMGQMCGEILRHNCALQNPGNRFPAMWGAVHDAVPDTDHGANILNLLQGMLMQWVEDKIYLLPAFPEKWSVEFKLHGPKHTVITCSYAEGKITGCQVQPQWRSRDVYIFTGGEAISYDEWTELVR